MRYLPPLIALLIFVVSCGGGGGGGSSAPPPPETGTSEPPPPLSVVEEQLQSLDGLTFGDLVNESFEILIRRQPEASLAAGLSEVPASLDDISEAFQDETLQIP